MKTIIIALLMTSLISAYAFASGGQEGNGGGGVMRNGQYMTFYSAQIVIDPASKTEAEIPGLTDIINFVNASDLFTAETAGTLLTALIPTSDRSYYDANKDNFSPEVEQRLIAEYSRVTGEPAADLTLFAVTDTNSKQTILLPNFYKLTKTEQMAILFHEALWIINPNSNYKDIIKKEMNFQSYLEDPSNQDKTYQLFSSIGSLADTLHATIKMDMDRKILDANGKISDNGSTMQLTPRNLFGQAYLNCIEDYDSYSSNTPGFTACYPRLAIQSNQLQRKFPNSMLIRFWNEKVLTKKTNINFSFIQKYDAAYGPDYNYSFAPANSAEYDIAFSFNAKAIDETSPRIIAVIPKVLDSMHNPTTIYKSIELIFSN